MKTIRSLSAIDLKYIDQPFNKEYKVDIEYKIVDQDEKETTTKIAFGIFIEFEPLKKGGWLLNIEKINLTINDGEGLGVMEELLMSTAEALENLQIVIDQSKQVIAINNRAAIIDKWILIRKDIESLYVDEFTKNVLNAMERQLENDEKLLSAIKRDLFLQFYLKGLFIQFDALNGYKMDVALMGIAGNDPIFCKQDQKIMNTDEGYYIQGKLSKLDSINDLKLANYLYPNTDKVNPATILINGKMKYRIADNGIIEGYEALFQITNKTKILRDIAITCQSI